MDLGLESPVRSDAAYCQITVALVILHVTTALGESFAHFCGHKT